MPLVGPTEAGFIYIVLQAVCNYSNAYLYSYDFTQISSFNSILCPPLVLPISLNLSIQSHLYHRSGPCYLEKWTTSQMNLTALQETNPRQVKRQAISPTSYKIEQGRNSPSSYSNFAMDVSGRRKNYTSGLYPRDSFKCMLNQSNVEDQKYFSVIPTAFNCTNNNLVSFKLYTLNLIYCLSVYNEFLYMMGIWEMTSFLLTPLSPNSYIYLLQAPNPIYIPQSSSYYQSYLADNNASIISIHKGYVITPSWIRQVTRLPIAMTSGGDFISCLMREISQWNQ